MTAVTARSASVLPTAFALLAALLLTAQHARAVSAAVSARMLLCTETLIPSLYGCTVLANLIQASGSGAWLGARLRHLAGVLRVPAAAMGIFLVSQLAGYPVGAVLLRKAADDGTLTPAEARQLAPCCFGGGPAFLVGLAGAKLFGAAAAGWAMLSACILSNLILLRVTGRRQDPAKAAPVQVTCSAEMLTDAVSAAVKTMAQICGTVLLFGVLTALSEQLGLLPAAVRIIGRCGISAQTAEALLHTLTDVSLLPELFYCGLPFRVLLPLTAGLLSFGGICVHCQCLAAGRGLCPLPRLFCIRTAAALLTAGITAALLPCIPLPETAAVFSAQTALSQSRSPLPAILIFLTGFPFLLKKD